MELGREAPEPRSEGEAPGDAGRGPPARLRRLRGRDPERRVRRRYGARLGHRKVAPRGATRKAGYARGRLAFTLEGKKLRGRWHLIRTCARRRCRCGRAHVAALQGQRRGGATGLRARSSRKRPESVQSGRSPEEVAGRRGARGSTNRGKRRAGHGSAAGCVAPQLDPGAQAARRRRAAHEQKFDSCLIQARIDGPRVKPPSRRGNGLVAAAADARARALRTLRSSARSSTARSSCCAKASPTSGAAERAVRRQRRRLRVLRLRPLHPDGATCVRSPLVERKKRCARRCARRRAIQHSGPVVGHGAESSARLRGWRRGRGVQRGAPYTWARSRLAQGEAHRAPGFVIGGYTALAGARNTTSRAPSVCTTTPAVGYAYRSALGDARGSRVSGAATGPLERRARRSRPAARAPPRAAYAGCGPSSSPRSDGRAHARGRCATPRSAACARTSRRNR